MKHSVLLALCACGINFGAQAQSTKPEPFKGANTIVIQTQDSSGVALRTLGELLVSQGFFIDKLDQQFNTLVTTGKSVPSLATDISLTIQARATKGPASVITLQGPYTFPSLRNTVKATAEFSGSQSTANKTAFAQMEKVAKAYPKAVVSYSKQ